MIWPGEADGPAQFFSHGLVLGDLGSVAHRQGQRPRGPQSGNHGLCGKARGRLGDSAQCNNAGLSLNKGHQSAATGADHRVAVPVADTLAQLPLDGPACRKVAFHMPVDPFMAGG